MKLRDMTMIGVGCMATIVYQKYNKKMMKAMKNTFNGAMEKMDKTLDDMM